MRQLVVHRKEKCLAADAAVGKLEVEVELITKRMRSTNAKIEQAANTLKQVAPKTDVLPNQPCFLADHLNVGRIRERKSR